MKWKSAYLSLLASICLQVSCSLLDQECIDAPPKWGKTKVLEWWNQKVENLPLDLLAVYAEASSVHIQQGTQATYMDYFEGRTMVGWYRHELRLPSPPPESVFARIQERLKNYEPATSQSPIRAIWQARNCRGCTEDQAMTIWLTACEKVRQAAEKERP